MPGFVPPGSPTVPLVTDTTGSPSCITARLTLQEPVDEGAWEWGTLQKPKEVLKCLTVGLWGGRDGTQPDLQIQLHVLPRRQRQTGESRVDLPQEPKGDETCGRERSCLCLSVCLSRSGLPRAALAPEEGKLLPRDIPDTRGGKTLIFPVVFRGSCDSRSCQAHAPSPGRCLG